MAQQIQQQQPEVNVGCAEISVEDLQDCELDSDLTILYAPDDKLPCNKVILRVGGEPFTDRGSLRVALATLAPTTMLNIEFHQPLKMSLTEGVAEADGMDSITTRMTKSGQWLDSDDDEELLPADIVRSASAASFSAQSHMATADNSAVTAGILIGGNRNSSGGDSPALLEFSAIDVTSQANFDWLERPGASNGLSDALTRTTMGQCLVILSEMVNPLGDIEIISKILRREYIVVDCALKMRQRPTQSQVLSAFFESMNKGRWFVITSGHKSIVTLRLIESAVAEAKTQNFKGWHPNARILIATNSHPHFPKALMDNCITLRFRASFSSSGLHQTMHGSVSKRKFIYGSVRATEKSVAALSAAARGELGMNGNGVMATTPGVSAAGGAPKKKRGVQLSTAVDIVEIPAREAGQKVTKQTGPVAGGIKLVSEFQGAEGDKFLCISRCGLSTDRLAVGSSLGNVYFLDYEGNSISAMHAHDASVWDLSCISSTSFMTGSEDGSAIRWGPQDGLNVQQKQVAKCGHDIFAVKYYNKQDENSPVFLGGLMGVVVGLLPKGQVTQVPVPSSTQALESMNQHNLMLIGGGDGSLVSIDVNRLEVFNTSAAHKKKLPCVAQDGENLIATGSFDSSIKLWDVRTPGEAQHTVKLKNYITGLAVQGNTLTGSVGSNLYIWDLRNLTEIRSGMSDAWAGLSRGMVVDEDLKEVVTASPDGVVRFWKYI